MTKEEKFEEIFTQISYELWNKNIMNFLTDEGTIMCKASEEKIVNEISKKYLSNPTYLLKDMDKLKLNKMINYNKKRTIEAEKYLSIDLPKEEYDKLDEFAKKMVDKLNNKNGL